MADPLQVKFIASDGPVWKGEAVSVLVRTTEGDIGIMSGHAPLMAALVPHGAEVLTVDGKRLILAIDTGFISVFQNHVSVLSATGDMAGEFSAEQATVELAALKERVQDGEADDAEMRRFHRLRAQVSAAEKYQRLHGSSHTA